jgi:hypothetical protein
MESSDGARAIAAAWVFVTSPRQALPFFKGRVQPILTDEQAIARAVADLGSKQFPVREKAVRQVEKVGELAEPALREALDQKPDLDLTMRVRRLLDRVDAQRLSPSGETAESRRMLEALAKGAAGAALTREAKAALERLDKRSRTP